MVQTAKVFNADPTIRRNGTQQTRLFALSRASVYYTQCAVFDADVALMRCLDALHLELPFAGSHMLRDLLRTDGHMRGREHVRMLMQCMGIIAIYRRPTSMKRSISTPRSPTCTLNCFATSPCSTTAGRTLRSAGVLPIGPTIPRC